MRPTVHRISRGSLTVSTFPRTHLATSGSGATNASRARANGLEALKRLTVRGLFLGAILQLAASVVVASTFNELGGGALLREGPPPQCAAPVAVISLAGMGLLTGDQIDALSFGDDFTVGLTHVLTFSVDASAIGTAGTGVAFEVTRVAHARAGSEPGPDTPP